MTRRPGRLRTGGPAFRTALGAPFLAVALLVLPAAASDRALVVAVNYPLAYFAERLAGAEAEVLLPVPAGADPAFWRPAIADIGTIQGADLILLNGAGFARWVMRVSLPRARVVDTARRFEDRFIATESVTHSHGPDGEHTHEGIASFTWLDQEQAVLQAQAVAEALAARGLVPAATVNERLAALVADLSRLDASAERLATLGEGTVIIATHPRYQYLARAYGLDIRAVEWEAGAAPDEDALAELEALAAETGAAVLLWEAAPPEGARAAVRARGLADVVFPTLAMPGADGDYVTRFETAVEALAAALTAREGG